MEKIYRIGTRKSPLALKQVEEVLLSIREIKPDFKAEITPIGTYGDADRTTPISKAEGSDFFTREIEDAVLNGNIDLAVHSAKDMPDDIREGLVVAAITGPIDPYDVLVSRSGLKLNELPQGAKIGTSSLRRKEALRKFRPDLQIVDIRGNIEERLALLDGHESRITNHESRDIDAIVIAAAGLVRLKLEHRITQRIPADILKPHPLQGALAVEVRRSDTLLMDMFNRLDTRKGGAI